MSLIYKDRKPQYNLRERVNMCCDCNQDQIKKDNLQQQQLINKC